MRTGGVRGHAHGVATMWTPLFLGSVWRPLKKSFQRHPTPSFQDLSTSHALPPPCRGLGPLSTRQDAGPSRMGYRCCCTSRASPVSYRDALWYHPLAVSLDRQLPTIQMLLLPFVSSRLSSRRPLSVPTLHFYHDPYCYTLLQPLLPHNNILFLLHSLVSLPSLPLLNHPHNLLRSLTTDDPQSLVPTSTNLFDQTLDRRTIPTRPDLTVVSPKQKG